jgi:PAS domain S-box-containing protein
MLFETAFQNAPIGMALTALDGALLKVNRAMCVMLGYTEAELLRVRFQAITHPDDIAGGVSNFERLVAGEVESFELDKRYVRSDGEIVWATLSCSLVRADDGSPRHLIAQVQDQTARRKAEMALKASEARYRLMVQNLTDVIITTGVSGHVTFASDAAEAVSGYKPKELVGRRPAEFMHPDDAEAVTTAFHGLLDGRRVERLRWRCKHRVSGRWVWLESNPNLMLDAETGAPTGYLDVVRDVTEQVAQENALAQARREADAANRAKSEFVANMSHEIRTPLNGVMGVASALARTDLSPAQREMVSIIETSARTLETLLSDVLDLARIEAGKMDLRHEPFDLAASVTACAALFDAAAQAKGLDLVVTIAPDATGVYVGDGARIRQILSNLLGNAVKFTQAGRVTLDVAARRGEAASELRFEVRDTGIGFDAETRARLFSRFEQADGSITRRFGGSGLGLSISHSLAEAMGGRLEADAVPGEGAVFTLTLELPRSEGGLEPAPEAVEAPASGPLEGMRVLLAEDHPTNRRVVELVLGAAGVDLTCVENGALAVDAFLAGTFDLVLMDMQMPVMDGLTAVREIRAVEAARGAAPTPIHVLTGNAMPEHVAASLAAGADGHLSKPIAADALLERVAETAARPADAHAQAAGRDD